MPAGGIALITCLFAPGTFAYETTVIVSTDSAFVLLSQVADHTVCVASGGASRAVVIDMAWLVEPEKTASATVGVSSMEISTIPTMAERHAPLLIFPRRFVKGTGRGFRFNIAGRRMGIRKVRNRTIWWHW